MGGVRTIEMRAQHAVMILAGLLSGCLVGPNYHRPPIDTPATFRFEQKDVQNVIDTAWWQQFQDPVLNGLIATAVKDNKDVRIAAARVEQFAAQLGTTRSQFFPQLNYSGTAQRERFSENTGVPLAPGVPNPQTTYQALATVSWEIDIWGRIRRLTEAAQAQLFASEEGRRAVILTLVTAVANSYVILRDLDKQLDIAKSTAKTYEETLHLFELRFKGGVISEVELAQVRSQYEQAVAAIPAIEKLVAQQEDALSVLLGHNPGPIPRGRSIDELALPVVPAGLPSDLLSRRPDILQAEQQLIAANAQIGAAKALYYPTISLTGFLGAASQELSHLFDSSSRAWNYTGSAAGPIFTGGSIKGQVKQAEAQHQQALVIYEQSIQNAFRDVDDALIDNQKSRQRLAAQGRQVDALRNYARLAWLRFNNGQTSYLEVLDAQRSLFDAELNQTQTQGAVFQALVNIYKAMGGGWVTKADQLAGSDVPPGAQQTDQPR
jgi:multidrug efflux system outer membrane protein